MTKPLISISGLYKIFGPKPASVLDMVKQGASKEEVLAQTGHTVGLKDINLDIHNGEIFVIMGLSGSGKSTLAHAVEQALHDRGLRTFVLDGDNVYSGCGLGMHTCDSEHPCPLHNNFIKIRTELKQMLENTSLLGLMNDIKIGKSFLKHSNPLEINNN